MITFAQKGDFKKTSRFLKAIRDLRLDKILKKYGEDGVIALSNATPRDTGKTAEAWNYEIKKSNGSVHIYWTNSNVNKGIPIVILIQYGHGTRNGGYVQGRDFINPAIRPIFDKIADDIWAEVRSL